MNNQTITIRICLLLLLCTAGVTSALAQVEEEQEVRLNQYNVKVDHFPLRTEAQNCILVLENPAKGYKFWMDNRVQFDAATYFNLKNGMIINGKPTMPGGVSMRRVRMAVKAQIAHYWYGEVDLNFSNGVFELEDAIIRFDGIRNVELSFGNFKEDFSMEETTTSRYTTFMERAMVVSCFAPGRHIGMQANWLPSSFLRASAGVSWQLIDNADTRYNVEEYNKVGKGMGANYTGKIVWMPWGSQPYYGLHIGYNASYRNAKKTDDNVIDGDKLVGRGYDGNYFSTRNTTAINRTKFLSTEFYGVKYDILQGFELAGYKDGLRIVGEWITNSSVMNKNYKGATVNMDTKHFWGYYVQASCLLFGGKQRYDITQSEFTQPSRGREWGDIELMARFDYLHLNTQDIKGGSGQNLAFGVVYHINNNVKMMLNYTLSKDDKYANNKGKAAIGRDINGDYTSNPKLAYNDFGVRFNSLQARIEIDF
ncbi:MAG: porin [Bacteroidetes bacterium]|nr:porin [Bacteroidota bacterium]